MQTPINSLDSSISQSVKYEAAVWSDVLNNTRSSQRVIDEFSDWCSAPMNKMSYQRLHKVWEVVDVAQSSQHCSATQTLRLAAMIEAAERRGDRQLSSLAFHNKSSMLAMQMLTFCISLVLLPVVVFGLTFYFYLR